MNLLLRRGERISVRTAGLTLVLLLGVLILVSGCATQNASSATSTNSGSAQSTNTTEDNTTQTAMVAYAKDNNLLLVDEETQTPFVVTSDNFTIQGINGETLTVDALTPGNIVTVVGNGIMMESYPGQYPGISAIEVISIGTPSDADRYSDIVASVFPPVDETAVPTGFAEYSNDLGQVSINLQAYKYSWQNTGNNESESSGNDATLLLDGSFVDSSGFLAPGITDALISGPTEITASFDRGFQSIVVNRFPLIVEEKGESKTVSVGLEASQEIVESTVVSSDSAAFTVEPNFVYTLDVKFAQGEASYAFYTTV